MPIKSPTYDINLDIYKIIQELFHQITNKYISSMKEEVLKTLTTSNPMNE